ncbi:hypothetical protein [Salipaludibacillus sp. CF4.18]|uniref:hypothetical protein n=1 Tax=Salipaludibacillus sp. CF4.18 TaxID=3373081 RepID=UPI003EE622FF
MDLRSYRVTIFLKFPFKELKSRLRGVGFKEIRDKLVWEHGDQFFEIMPFRKQSGHYGSYGYRLLFNYDMDAALYIFESNLGFFKPNVTNVEFQWSK